MKKLYIDPLFNTGRGDQGYRVGENSSLKEEGRTMIAVRA